MSVEEPTEVDSSPGRNGEDHLKLIFNLCDQDKDGFISAQDFRSLGNEHFGNSQVSEKERDYQN
jgi:Ca2+-binding EF-hand superfamily protein